MAKEKEVRVKEEIKDVERNGRCLNCKRPLVKNHMTCRSCMRKKRLIKKANRRGKNKYTFLR